MQAATSHGNLPAKVGDKIELTVKGPMRLGHGVFVMRGGRLTIEGTIIGEIGDHWHIELSTSVNDENQIWIPKTSQRYRLKG